MQKESFGLPSNSHSSNNSHKWGGGVLEKRLSDQNYDKMTKSTKSNEMTQKTKNDIIMKTLVASQYYEYASNQFETRDIAIFKIKDLSQVAVANQ